MLQHILGAGPFGGVDGETAPDELLGRLGDILPILSGLKFVVTSNDGLRLLVLRVPIERCITAEEEIGNNAHGPDVNRFMMASCMGFYQSTVRRPRETEELHQTLTLQKDLWRHVLKSVRVIGVEQTTGEIRKIRTHPRGTADFGQEAYLVGFDDSAEAEIADHDVCVLTGVPEQQVFWLKVTVNDATFVKVCNSAEDDPDEFCGIPVMEGDRVKHRSRKGRDTHFS